MKQTDTLLAIGTLALVLFALTGLAATDALDGFLSWERHHNVLSWYMRPLFILPLAYFAYRRSLFGFARREEAEKKGKRVTRQAT